MQDDDALELVRGRLYARRGDIHARFGGAWIRGISPSRSIPAIFLFSGGVGPEIGYPDHWRSDDTYIFHGEGRAGDQRMVAGNAAIRDAEATNRQLYLFHRDGRAAYVSFLGMMRLRDIELADVPDINDVPRLAFRFVLETVAEHCVLRPPRQKVVKYDE